MYSCFPTTDGLPPSLVELRLASYAGWGVNASNLRVLPETPFPQGYVLPQYQPCDPPVLIRMNERYPATAAATGAFIEADRPQLLAG